jgi:hypothetical protein
VVEVVKVAIMDEVVVVMGMRASPMNGKGSVRLSDANCNETLASFSGNRKKYRVSDFSLAWRCMTWSLPST